MKYRVLHIKNGNATYTPATYFKTKRKAIEYSKQYDGLVQRKLANIWVNYPKKINENKYIVETNMTIYEFKIYNDAELFCGYNGIHCENIYEK